MGKIVIGSVKGVYGDPIRSQQRELWEIIGLSVIFAPVIMVDCHSD